jgi:hypothetical protein
MFTPCVEDACIDWIGMKHLRGAWWDSNEAELVWLGLGRAGQVCEHDVYGQLWRCVVSPREGWQEGTQTM